MMALGSIPPRSACGYAGLQNQGATCYLNSLLQVLYCTHDLRKALFEWHFDESTHGEAKRCVSRQLQELFAELQLCARGSVHTSKLTRSFGWDDADALNFQQNDVHECMGVMLDAVARETAGSPLSELVSRVAAGYTEDVIVCTGCNGARTRRDDFRSIMLPVRGCADVHAAMTAYMAEEVMEGDNAYRCEACGGLRTAKRCNRLPVAGLPQTLFLQLNRFEFDMNTLSRKKVNDRLQPVVHLDMRRHVYDATDATDDSKVTYELVAIMMHVGGAMAGHYFAYVLTPDAGWVHFNDSSVSTIPDDSLPRALGQTAPAAAAPAAALAPSSTAAATTTTTGAGALPQNSARRASLAAADSGVVVGHAAMAVATGPARSSDAASTAPLTDAAVGAYMLVYRRADTVASFLSPVDTAIIERGLRERLAEENEKYLAARREYEAERARVRVRVYYCADTVAKLLHVSREAPAASASASAAPVMDAVDIVVNESDPANKLLDEVIVAAHKRLAGPSSDAAVAPPAYDPNLARLRHYNAMKGIALAPVGMAADESATAEASAPFNATPTVRELDLASGRTLVLETRGSTEESWPVWYAGALALKLVVLDPTTRQYSSPVQIVLPPGEATVGTLREHAARACAPSARAAGLAAAGVPPRCRLVYLKPDSEENACVLGDDAAQILDAAAPLRIAAGDTIHVEVCPQDGAGSDPRSHEGSFIVNMWDTNINTVSITFNVPEAFSAGAPATTAVRIDQRNPLGELRETIARILSVDGRAFKLRRAPSQPEMKDDALPLTYYGIVGGGSVHLDVGKPLLPDEFELKLSYFVAGGPGPQPNAAANASSETANTDATSATAARLEPLGSIVLRGGMTASEAKASIAAWLSSKPVPDALAEGTHEWPSAARFRLRERSGALTTKLGAVYVDARTLLSNANGRLTDGKELVLQPTDQDEEFRDGDILLTVTWWRPLLGDTQVSSEAAYSASSPLSNFAGILCSSRGVNVPTGGRVKLAKLWQWQMGDMTALWKLKWHSVTVSAPVPLLDASLATTAEESFSSPASTPSSRDAASTLTAGSPRAFDSRDSANESGADASVAPARDAVISTAPAKQLTLAGDPLRLKHGDCVAFVLAEDMDSPAAIGRPEPAASTAGSGTESASGRRWGGGHEAAFKIFSPEEQRAREAAKAAEAEERKREAEERAAAVSAALSSKLGASRDAASLAAQPAQEHADEAAPPGIETAAPTPLEKYVRLVQMGMNPEAVRNKMRFEGVDPSLLPA